MTIDRNSPEFFTAIRQVLQTLESPLDFGWNLLSRERRRQQVHLTDKELFLAGAGFLFDAIIHALDPAGEPTEQDLVMLTKIHNELMQFHQHFNAKFKE